MSDCCGPTDYCLQCNPQTGGPGSAAEMTGCKYLLPLSIPVTERPLLPSVALLVVYDCAQSELVAILWLAFRGRGMQLSAWSRSETKHL